MGGEYVTMSNEKPDKRLYKFTAEIKDCEIRKIEDVNSCFINENGKRVENRYILLSIDQGEQCDRLFLKDKNMDRLNKYKRGITGTFTVNILVEEEYGCKCKIYVTDFISNDTESALNKNNDIFSAANIDYKWKENEDGSITITDYTGNNSNIIIPSKINNKPVTAIDYAFLADYSGLTSITIPDSVTHIVECAFSDCTRLTDINVDENNKNYSSKDGVLFNKDKTTLITYPTGKKGAYVIPDTVIKIDYVAFYDCRGLTDVTISENIIKIGKAAFSNCMELTNIIIPNNVKTIDDEAFCNCKKLTNITIPNSVTSIGNDVFYKCNALTIRGYKNSCAEICANKNDIPFVTINTNAVDDYKWKENEDSSVTVTNYTGNDSNVIIPSKINDKPVTSIHHDLFLDYPELINVTIPDSITNIDEYTFSNCIKLININVNKDNKNYTSENGILFNKDKTVLITCPPGKKGAYVIPDNIIEISSLAFYNCTKLTNITIPESVTSIGNLAFSNCKNLTNIKIPNSVTTIGDWAFCNCSRLTHVTISNDITSIGEYAFHDCKELTRINITANNKYYSNSNGVLFDKEQKKLIYCPEGFKGSYIIPDGVTSINNFAFNNCTKLTDITIPASVIKIGCAAFHKCNNFTIHGYKNSYAETYANENNISFAVINSNTINDYKWKENEDSKSITITEYTGNDSYIAIPSEINGKTVTAIDGNAFYDCINITNIIIPDSITKLGDDAFYNCTNLTNVIIPDSVTEIGNSAFAGCIKLTNITIPKNITKINDSTFWNCTSLTDITLPDCITEIGASAFADCINLTSITIPDNVIKIDGDAFSGCTGLTNITVPNNVTSIDHNAFTIGK